ncbi:MAG: hypothetical protein AB1592_18760 [Pseudomonadota bacterium]
MAQSGLACSQRNASGGTSCLWNRFSLKNMFEINMIIAALKASSAECAARAKIGQRALSDLLIFLIIKVLWLMFKVKSGAVACGPVLSWR